MSEERNTEPIRVYRETKRWLAEVQHGTYVKTGEKPSYADILEAMRVTAEGKGFEYATEQRHGATNAAVMKMRESTGELVAKGDPSSEILLKVLAEIHGLTRRELEHAAVPPQHGKHRLR